jgi:hypothetical protein
MNNEDNSQRHGVDYVEPTVDYDKGISKPLKIYPTIFDTIHILKSTFVICDLTLKAVFDELDPSLDGPVSLMYGDALRSNLIVVMHRLEEVFAQLAAEANQSASD